VPIDVPHVTSTPPSRVEADPDADLTPLILAVTPFPALEYATELPWPTDVVDRTISLDALVPSVCVNSMSNVIVASTAPCSETS
jgi:hypothetical protein